MIGVITPLVKGLAGGWRWRMALTAFGAGALTSGFLTAVVLRAMVTPVRGFGAAEARWAAIALVPLLVYFIAADLAIGSLKPPSVRRQTSPEWRHYMPLPTLWFAWGVDLGTGFTTIRVTSLYWACLAIALLELDPWAAALVPISYAIGVVVGIGTATAIVSRSHSDSADALVRSAYRTRVPARLTSSALYLAIAGVLVAFATHA